MSAVFDNPAIEKIFVVILQVADLVQTHLLHGGSECDFQGTMPVTKGKAQDGRLMVVAAVEQMELIVHRHASPVVADRGRGLGPGRMLVRTDKDLTEEVLVFKRSRPQRGRR